MPRAHHYVIIGRNRPSEAWTTVDGDHDRERAIEVARGMLDRGELVAAVVQGRPGEDGPPTPPGEIQVYRGVAPGYRAHGFFSPAVPLDEIERRKKVES